MKDENLNIKDIENKTFDLIKKQQTDAEKEIENKEFDLIKNITQNEIKTILTNYARCFYIRNKTKLEYDIEEMNEIVEDITENDIVDNAIKELLKFVCKYE